MNIGKIISVEYDKFRVKLFHTTKTSTISINGTVYYFGNIGSFLKVKNSTGDTIICEVIAVLDNSVESKLFSNFNLDSARELVIKPIGTLRSDNSFDMGVGVFPSIYSDVFIVTTDDIECILRTTQVNIEDNNQIHKEFEIGYSKNMINYKIHLNVNKLFNIHTAVLGNSGSGKSNTIAHILQSILRKKDFCAKGAKFILFDVNGEYKKAFDGVFDDKLINVSLYKPNIEQAGYVKFALPYYLMTLDEWSAFLMASDRTQKPFWDRVLQECYKFYKTLKSDDSVSNDEFTNYFKWKIRNILTNVVSQVESDTSKMTAAQGAVVKCQEIIGGNNPVLKTYLNEINNNCSLSYGKNDNQLIDYLTGIEIDETLALKTDSKRLRTGEYFDYMFLRTAVDIVLLEEESKGNTRIREFTSTMLSRLDYFLYNSDCNFMKESNGSFIDSESDYLQNILGINIDTMQKQLIIIDSSEVGSDILELMTSVVSRIIFDYRKKKQGEDRRIAPVHLILDEAHRYIKKNTEYILKENIFEKIAREGRKYSYYLIISSQRPSELSETVLSQCGNYIIHRIQNEIDMKYIYSVLPYFSGDYINKIKQSIPGEALVFGNCVPMPLHIKVHQANPEPNSENCNISEQWFRE